MPTRPERFGIMLCYPTEEGRVHRLGNQCFAQPKLNGERCRVEWFHGEPILISSYGNQFQYLDHITHTIKELSRKEGEVPWDGELYVHGWPRERIHSACSRKVNENPDSAALQLHIFDYQDNLNTPQWQRIAKMNHLKNTYIGADPLQFVHTKAIDTINWTDTALTYCDLGYEGIILRHLLGIHILQRTVTMLKFKPREKDEYTIVGVKEGTGWAKGMLGAFIVQGEDSTEFAVGSGKTLTKERRGKFWEIRGELPGKMLVVKHEKLKTVGGIPVACVAEEVKGVNI